MLSKEKKKYLMANGIIRVTNIYPSGTVRIANFDVKLKKRIAWKLMIENLGYVYDQGQIFTPEEAKKRLISDVFTQINKQDPTYRKDDVKSRSEILSRCAIALSSHFSQWKTLKKYAEEALELWQNGLQPSTTSHEYVREMYRLIKKIGLQNASKIIEGEM